MKVNKKTIAFKSFTKNFLEESLGQRCCTIRKLNTYEKAEFEKCRPKLILIYERADDGGGFKHRSFQRRIKHVSVVSVGGIELHVFCWDHKDCGFDL